MTARAAPKLFDTPMSYPPSCRGAKYSVKASNMRARRSTESSLNTAADADEPCAKRGQNSTATDAIAARQLAPLTRLNLELRPAIAKGTFKRVAAVESHEPRRDLRRSSNN